MLIRWSQTSVEQLGAIQNYLAPSSANFAKALVKRIANRVRLLAKFPESGAVVPEFDDSSIREVLEHPYRVIYRASDEDIQVLAIIHGARQLPSNLPPAD